MEQTVQVKALWDKDAGVWVATGDDIPGLVTEAETLEQLVRKLHVLIPELMELNGLMPRFRHTDIPFHLMTERTETIHL